MSDGEQPEDSSKTEDPTPKKLEEARKKGQVPLSRELNNWIMLFIGTLLVATFAGKMFTDLDKLLVTFIERAHDMPSIPGGLNFVLGESLVRVMGIMVAPIFLLLLAAFLAPFIQVGPLFAPDLIKPDISKISPLKGFKRLFSKRSLMEFVKGILKITLIAIVGTMILWPYFDKTEHMVGLPVNLLLLETQTLIVRLMIGVLVALFFIAIIDVLYQRADHMKKMRMTKQELKDEYKQTEGDPMVRAKLRQLRAERARRRMMQSVPRADVVITNPTHYSIALEYKPEVMDAPVCVAKGLDNVAMKIREIAKKHDIILYENPPLARSLYDVVEIGDVIPQEQYKAVAEVISFVFQSRQRS